MANSTAKPIHSLIVDTGPIIKNEPAVSTLLSQSETLYTIPAIIDEIRDATTRARIETTLLPFLTLRSPKAISIKIITDFARKTGDLEVLSRPDVHLMALAYELECERNHGDWRLRSVPGQKRVNGSPPPSLTEGTSVENSASEKVEVLVQPDPAPAAVAEKKGAWGAIPPPSPDVIGPKISVEAEEKVIEESLREVHISEPEQQFVAPHSEAVVEKESPAEEQDTPESVNRVPEVDSSMEAEEGPTSDNTDTDYEGWITPSNLKKHMQKDATGTSNPREEPKTMQVALITSDFAMQNVLLRMNLNLLSPSLQRIRQLKTWVLRCHACFDITRDMKQFCKRCGKPTLLRTSCSTDEKGNFRVHLKKNIQWNNRGNVFSVPKPVAGSSSGKMVIGGGKGGWGQELILAEDQKEYVRAMASEKRRKEKDLMDDDYLPNLLSGDRGRAGGRPRVGAGKGVNSKKRR